MIIDRIRKFFHKKEVKRAPKHYVMQAEGLELGVFRCEVCNKNSDILYQRGGVKYCKECIGDI